MFAVGRCDCCSSRDFATEEIKRWSKNDSALCHIMFCLEVEARHTNSLLCGYHLLACQAYGLGFAEWHPLFPGSSRDRLCRQTWPTHTRPCWGNLQRRHFNQPGSAEPRFGAVRLVLRCESHAVGFPPLLGGFLRFDL